MTEREEGPVNHPAHYKAASGLECIEVIEALGLGYHLGNVLKYLWRTERKGSPVEDLMKARWYLDREIELRRQRETGTAALSAKIDAAFASQMESHAERHDAAIFAAADGELRRQRDAAQESVEEGRPEDSWPSGQAPAGIDRRAPSPASTLADHLGRSSAAFSGHEADDLRHERDRLANALAVCGVVARGRRQAYPPEHGSDTLKAIEVLLAERDEARAELDKLKQVQGACRERIYALLADDDLSDAKLRQFAERGLPEIHDALHQASGYAASECFTQGPAEAYLRQIAERERDEARARLRELEPLVERLVKHYEGLAFVPMDPNDVVGALVLHERRRAKGDSDARED